MDYGVALEGITNTSRKYKTQMSIIAAKYSLYGSSRLRLSVPT